MASNQAANFWHYLRMAEDALDRAKDNAEGDAFATADLSYTRSQLAKATHYIFRAVQAAGGKSLAQELACIPANGQL